MRVREALKAMTADAHAALDDLVEASGFFDSLVGYAGFLSASAAAHADVESGFEAGGFTSATFLPTPRRSRMAAEDLAALDRPSPPPPAPIALPADSAAAALGRLYVVEGSSLGGRVLAARVARAPQLSGAPVRFLTAEAIDPTRRWRACVDALDLGVPEDRLACAAEAALKTFDRFRTAFSAVRSTDA